MTNAIVAALLVVYPVVMWLALETARPRAVASIVIGAFLVVAVAALLRTHELLPLLVRRFGVLVVLALVAVAFDHPLALKLLPVFTHLWLFLTFASTLRSGPSLVEQFARSAHGGRFPDFLRPYTRFVTALWCVFFAVNMVVYVYLAVAAPIGTWAFYTGFGCYAVIFVLIASEYVLRKVRFRFYEDVWTDRLWSRVLPPEGTEYGRRILAWRAGSVGEDA